MIQPKWKNFSTEQLKEIFENSSSYKQIAEKLGYSYSGTVLSTIKKIAQEYNFQLHLNTKTKEQKEYDIQNLIGKTFGRLKILSIDEIQSKEKSRIYYKCQCSCKNKTIVSIRKDALLDKKHPTLSCGCLQKEAASCQGIANREDLTGYKTGKLTIMKYNPEISAQHVKPYWDVKCECGHCFTISSSAIKAGQISCGCERSLGEYNVNKILTKLQILYIKEYSFEDLLGDNRKLRFDFYLPHYNILIECQGQQHYNPQQPFGGEEQFKKQMKYDNLKRQYCKNKNIKLIEIPYWDYNKLNEDYLLSKINS